MLICFLPRVVTKLSRTSKPKMTKFQLSRILDCWRTAMQSLVSKFLRRWWIWSETQAGSPRRQKKFIRTLKKESIGTKKTSKQWPKAPTICLLFSESTRKSFWLSRRSAVLTGTLNAKKSVTKQLIYWDTLNNLSLKLLCKTKRKVKCLETA